MEFNFDEIKKLVADTLGSHPNTQDAVTDITFQLSDDTFQLDEYTTESYITMYVKHIPVVEIAAKVNRLGKCVSAEIIGIYSLDASANSEINELINPVTIYSGDELILGDEVESALNDYLVDPVDAYVTSSYFMSRFHDYAEQVVLSRNITVDLDKKSTTANIKLASQNDTGHSIIFIQYLPDTNGHTSQFDLYGKNSNYNWMKAVTATIDTTETDIHQYIDKLLLESTANDTSNQYNPSTILSQAILHFANDGKLEVTRSKDTGKFPFQEPITDVIAKRKLDKTTRVTDERRVTDIVISIINKAFNNSQGASADDPTTAYIVTTAKAGNLCRTFVRHNDADGDIAFTVLSTDSKYRFITNDGVTTGADEPLTEQVKLPYNVMKILRGTIGFIPESSQSDIIEVNRIADRIDKDIQRLTRNGWTPVAFNDYKGLQYGLKGSTHSGTPGGLTQLNRSAEKLGKDLSGAMYWIVSPSGKIAYNPFTNRVYSTFAMDLAGGNISRKAVQSAPNFSESMETDITSNYIGSGINAAINAERIINQMTDTSVNQDTEMASFIYDNADDENHAFMEAVMDGYCACFEANLGNIALALGLPAAALAAGSWYGAKKMGYDPAELLSQLKPETSTEQVTIPSAEKQDVSEKGGLKDDIYHYAGKLKGKAIDAASDLMAKTSSKISEFERAHQPEFSQPEINEVDRIVDRIDNDMRILKNNDWTKIPFKEYKGSLDGLKGSIHSSNQHSATRLMKCAKHMDEDITGAMYWMVAPSGKIAYNPFTDEVYSTFQMNLARGLVSGRAALDAPYFSDGIDSETAKYVGAGMQTAIRAEKAVQAASGKEAERMGQTNLRILQHPDLPERSSI